VGDKESKMKKEGKNIAKAHAAVEKRPYTSAGRGSASAEGQVREI
jgi:hypothetical protein